jgi:hypothetical protein
VLITRRVTNEKELEKIFRERYRIFVERDKDAPIELYPNGIMKDKCDDDAIHIACYDSLNASLLGFLSVVLKLEDKIKLPIEEQHDLFIEIGTAEIMRLIIIENKNIKLKGHILNGLLKEIEFQKNIFDSKTAEGIFFTNVDIYDMHLSVDNTISFPYYPNTILKLPFESFDDYLNNQKAKRRWDIKNKQKIFSEQGCSIEVIQNSKINEEDFSILYELYANTEKDNFETINYQHYCDCDKFQSFKYLTDDFIWIIAKLNGKIIGFALLVHDESKLTLKHVGLEYSVNRQTYSYFNLFYRAIKFGIDNHYRYIICGSTTYGVKVSLGCELIDRTAYISIDKSKSEDVSDLYNLTLGGNL